MILESGTSAQAGFWNISPLMRFSKADSLSEREIGAGNSGKNGVRLLFSSLYITRPSE